MTDFRLLEVSEADLAKAEALSLAYQTVFGTDAGARSREQLLVLADLAQFCGAYKALYSDHPHETAYREGRREVWLRIHDPLRRKLPTVAELLATQSTTEERNDEQTVL